MSAASLVLAVCLSVFLLYPSSPAAAQEGIVVPVIMYHGFSEKESRINRYVIHPARLEEDILALKRMGCTAVTADELCRHFSEGYELPEKPVILSFDDGALSNYEYAFPLLQKYGVKAVIAPIGKACELAAGEKYKSVEWSQCTWEQLAEMEKSGLAELAYHTYDLHSATGDTIGAQAKNGEDGAQYASRLGEDVEKFDALMKKYTGKSAGTFVYPFGATRGGSEELLRSLGFSCAFDCEEKVNVLQTEHDLFCLHRFLRPDDMSAEEFFAKLGLS